MPIYKRYHLHYIFSILILLFTLTSSLCIAADPPLIEKNTTTASTEPSSRFKGLTDAILLTKPSIKINKPALIALASAIPYSLNMFPKLINYLLLAGGITTAACMKLEEKILSPEFYFQSHIAESERDTPPDIEIKYNPDNAEKPHNIFGRFVRLAHEHCGLAMTHDNYRYCHKYFSYAMASMLAFESECSTLAEHPIYHDHRDLYLYKVAKLLEAIEQDPKKQTVNPQLSLCLDLNANLEEGYYMLPKYASVLLISKKNDDAAFCCLLPLYKNVQLIFQNEKQLNQYLSNKNINPTKDNQSIGHIAPIKYLDRIAAQYLLNDCKIETEQALELLDFDQSSYDIENIPSKEDIDNQFKALLNKDFSDKTHPGSTESLHKLKQARQYLMDKHKE